MPLDQPAEQHRLPAGGWQPRAYQRKLWDYLERGGKRAVAIWHRRAGKDEVCLHWAAVAAHQRVGVYWHMLPEQAQARKAIWDAVNPWTGQRRINEAFPRELRESTRETDMAIRFRSGACGSSSAATITIHWSAARRSASCSPNTHSPTRA